jgi:dinuclear metal center YbgI/SA1388 family protein
MVRLKQITGLIEKFAPLSLQGSYDNCGLKVGDPEQEISGVLVTLDTNEAVVNEALQNGCNLIVEHHPSIFGTINRFDYNLPLTKAMTLAIKTDTAVYSSHTNIDFCDGGLNDRVAKIMGLKNVFYLEVPSDPRIGELEKETTLAEYANFLGEIFGDRHIATVGDPDRKIKKVAVVNGGGGGHSDDLLKSKAFGADVFVTGDVKYSVARLAKDDGYAIIQFGHYDSEQAFMPLMEELLKKEFGELKICKATSLSNPYN